MLKNDKGVTMFALAITVVLLIILMSVSVNTGFSVISDIRIGRVISNMTLVQKKVEVINEEYEFYNNDTDCLAGENAGKIENLENITISEDEKNSIAENAGVEPDDVLNWEWYKWDASVLEAQGLDKAMLNDDEAFFVNYEHAEIIFSRGTAYDDSEDFYSMSGLKDIYTE